MCAAPQQRCHDERLSAKMPGVKGTREDQDQERPVARRAYRAAAFLSWCLLLIAYVALRPSLVHAAPVAEGNGWAHRHYGVEEGAPPSIRALAQDRDGFIWVGASDGLYRFDGLHFDRIPPSSPRPLQSDVISTLLPEPNGDLWVGHDWGGLSLFRNGRHVRIQRPALGSIFSLTRGADGSSWAITIAVPWATFSRLDGERWRPMLRLPFRNMYFAPPVIDRTGVFWVIRDNSLWAMAIGRLPLHRVLANVGLGASLTLDRTGRAWLASGDRLRVLSIARDGALGRSEAPDLRAPTRRLSSFAFDRGGSVWQFDPAGILASFGADPAGLLNAAPSFRTRTAPVESLVYPPLLIDAEGSVWAATTNGLEQYRRTAFVPVQQLSLTAPTESADPLVLRDGKGDVWIRRGEALFRVAADGSLLRQPVSVPATSAPCAGYAGGIWIANGRGRIALHGGPRAASLSLSGTSQFGKQPFSSCAEDAAGRLWIQDGGTLKLLDGSGLRTLDLGADNGVPVANFAAEPRGSMTFYVSRGSLWQSDGRRSRILWNEKAIRLGFAEFLYRGPSHLLLGGDRGLMRHDGGRWQMLSSARLPEFSLLGGAVQTPAGDTWLQSIRGVIRVRTSDLDRAFDDPGFTPQLHLFTPADGLPGAMAFFNRSNITADRQGRIWVGTTGGIARFDPASSPAQRRPPNVVITSLRADAQELRPSSRIILANQPGRVQIGFTAPTFTDPASTVMRYRLTGIDRGWVAAGRDRSAAYINLAPGSYRFQVIAANADGVWNKRGATFELVVPARFYQTWWFRLLCIVATIGLVVVIFRWRLTAVTRRLRMQAAERADERERIARELHDTLLQSVQGLVLMFQSVARRMGPGDPNHAVLERTLVQADEVIAEGKARVLDLRASEQPIDLCAFAEAILRKIPFEAGVAAVFACDGPTRDIRPEIAHELGEIMAEALFNAARHSKAEHVRLEVTFRRRRLTVAIVDDGVGFEPGDVVRSTPTGFGLTGMRERARRIDGRFDLSSAQGKGTSVRVRVSARRAFTRHRAPRRGT
jgi:signal transduction histidine kinase/ligand-binding sensor domain-containing protein